MKRILMALAACCAMAPGVRADNVPVVVELFTSQGCSSCPPADEFMGVLAARDDVIALSLHVDYWDYIGWKDEFADPKHAERQRAYASIAGRRSVYTPEMIVNGESDIVGAKPMAVATAIEAHKSMPRTVGLELSRQGDRLFVDAQVTGEVAGDMMIRLVRYQPARTARITRGENAGKTISYVNVAQDWQVLGDWNGDGAFSTSVDVTGAHPLVVMVQSVEQGHILAAARLR